MYPRTIILTLASMLSFSAVLHAAPIDEVNANILAMKNNLGCTAPEGCQRNATAVALSNSDNSGALSALPPLALTTPAVAVVVSGLIASLL
ncbi:hypothetical protein QCA50_005163 [Cerrena zonata]|uniref:Secreted protein n=1 Tax=Cerrena zonata TaxID=2478898 RepID=A0AAW0GGM1_9APHY